MKNVQRNENGIRVDSTRHVFLANRSTLITHFFSRLLYESFDDLQSEYFFISHFSRWTFAFYASEKLSDSIFGASLIWFDSMAFITNFILSFCNYFNKFIWDDHFFFRLSLFSEEFFIIVVNDRRHSFASFLFLANFSLNCFFFVFSLLRSLNSFGCAHSTSQGCFTNSLGRLKYLAQLCTG